ncbi:MAG: orotate phosphoribosyltransferase [Syntrophales bacterium]|nr:orotate phosphoribosyltransferase [Syntrophales bacterium]HPL63568.1 orotate phosphoribosyltransferase [Syntrophales bacterium]
MDTSKDKKRLIEIILERSFKYSPDEPFTLASGRKSEFYFDCKPTTLDPEGMNLIGRVLFEMLRDTGITAAGGLSLGADPIANAVSLISFQRGRPIKSFIVRKDAKGHGTKNRIEGNVIPGERVAVLDDVATTGGSTITAIEAAAEAGFIVDRAVVLIDREEGGMENIRRRVGRVDSVLTRTEIMEAYRQKNR